MLSNLSMRGTSRVPMKLALGFLAAALMVGLGPEVAKLPRWADALLPSFVGNNMNVIGAAVVGWLSTFFGYKQGPETGYKPGP